MNNSRLKLDEMLKNLPCCCNCNVYYQPPESLKLNYPAILYSRERIDPKYADNIVYLQSRGYRIVVIDKDPDSEIVDAVSKLPGCRYDSNYKKDGFNYDVFSIKLL